ncbi:MAG: Sec-independent protein translocase protein TatB [Caulobacteraceae bacterium]|nr:Sec-independent protein translocase protein TatB [Caulobacteraceae bacterium]
MLPGVGGLEYVVIAILALVVIGPKDLPMLMRKAGAFLNRLRRMADEFRASFDEMARQSELDELRKQVEELRSGQLMQPLSAEIAPAMSEIDQDIRNSLSTHWTGAEPAAAPSAVEPEAGAKPAKPKRARSAKPAAPAKPKRAARAAPAAGTARKKPAKGSRS